MSVEKVDERIHGLEHRRQTESLSLKEEKELMSEIKALKASRAGIAGYDDTYKALEGQRATNDAKKKELKAVMDSLDTEIDALSAKQAKLTETLEKTGIKVETDIPKLAKERDLIRPEVTKLYDAMRAMRDAYKKAQDIWWDTEKVWRDQDRADRQVKWEADRKQRLIDDELYRKEMFEMEQGGDSDPFTEQKLMVSELSKYLTGLITADVKEVVQLVDYAVDGEQCLGKNSNRAEEEGYWGGLQKKKKKGKKRGTMVAKQEAIVGHPPTRLAALEECGIPIPSTYAAVQASIDACAAKMGELEGKSADMPVKAKKVYVPRKIALRIAPKGETDIKVTLDIIDLPDM